jgi:hypothetical protein
VAGQQCVQPIETCGRCQKRPKHSQRSNWYVEYWREWHTWLPQRSERTMTPWVTLGGRLGLEQVSVHSSCSADQRMGGASVKSPKRVDNWLLENVSFSSLARRTLPNPLRHLYPRHPCFLHMQGTSAPVDSFACAATNLETRGEASHHCYRGLTCYTLGSTVVVFYRICRNLFIRVAWPRWQRLAPLLLESTPSVQKQVSFLLPEESNVFNFNRIYTRKY